MSTLTAQQVAHVDVLVVGGSAGAVACAIAAAKAGRSTLLAAPRSYLGDDICAPLHLWRPESAPFHPLIRALWPTADAVSTPLHIKRTLDEAALEAGVTILLETFPAGIMRDPAGVLCGVLLATRGGLQGISATRIVDATRTSTIGRQAGHGRPLGNPLRIDAHRVCADYACDQGRPLPVGLPTPTNEGFDASVPAFELTGTIVLRGTAPHHFLDADSDAKWSAYQPAPQIMADDAQWTLPPEAACSPGAPAAGTASGDDQVRSLGLEDGRLWLLGPCAAGGRFAKDLADPCGLIDAGSRLGEHLADRAAGRSTPSVGRIGLGGMRERGLSFPHQTRRRQAQDLPEVAITDDIPILADVDVLVVGGGTGGAPAAIGAAREGARTLLIERGYALGGVGTVGQIACYYFGNKTGFTTEVDAAVHVLGGEPRPRTTSGSTWDIGWKGRWWHEQLVRDGGRVWFGVTCCGVQKQGDQVIGVIVASEHGSGLIRAKSVVDATGAAEIAHLAGAPTVVVGEEHVAVQGTGLADVLPGRNYRNSDHTFSDDSDPVDTTRMFIASRQKYGNAWDAGQLIDSRERRRIAGRHELSPVDILTDRTFPDAIARATSNFDSHGFTIHPLFLILPPDKRQLWAWLPYRCLLPQVIDGVLVTGLGMSAHRDALPVVRMQADVQNTGYAAGIAAAMASRLNTTVGRLDVRLLQKRLVAGGLLDAQALATTDSFPVSDEELQRAVTDELQTHRGIALCLAEGERARTGLRQALRTSAHPAVAAMILGLNGNPEAAELLRRLIHAETAWDAGWNFKGMGQYGMSMSRIDGLLVALAHCGSADDHGEVLRFAGLLDGDAAFSHIRSVAWAGSMLARRFPEVARQMAGALHRLILLPGMRGHAQTSLAQAVAAARRLQGLNETTSRNDALKELHLAAALIRCGDWQCLGHEVLTGYCQDVRGHFSRHASAVLAARRSRGLAFTA